MKFRNLLGALAVSALVGLGSAPAPAATPEDQLVIGVSLVNMLSLDPSAMSGRESMEMNSNVYDQLVEADPVKLGTYHPRLAKSWEIADDHMSITFKLRDDVTFNSGNPLTAEDFIWSFWRAFKLGIGGSTLRVYGYTVENIPELVTAPDPHTLVIRLPKPNDPMLLIDAIASTGVLMVIDKKLALEHAKDGDEGQGWLTTNSAGSGPYVLRSWQANNAVILERSDDYWGEAPKFRRIIYRHMPESQTKRLALQRGDIDIGMGMAVSDITALQTDAKLKTAEVRSGNVYYLAASMKNEKYADKNVRLALRHLIDYEGINNTILPFYGKLLQRPVPHGLSGALPDPMYKFDPELAKKYLADAGFPDGFSTTIRVLAESPFVNIATAIQASLAQGGIKAEILTGNGDQVYGAMRARDFEFIVGRGGDRNGSNAYSALLSLVYNPNNADDAKLFTLQAWRTSFQSKEINTLLETALLEPDAEKQKKMYEDIQLLYEELVPSLQPISLSYSTVVYQADLVDYVPHPFENTRYRDTHKQR
ncbi:ABC transporter substrate-binding protein [Oryzicola mucosus]|uniref:ABC transporter substrate-binding protein n=1 Tax=Oryzicola mucosus TaxID=2767425 RepID=A0A8J6PVZ7_9HYPH|nr:ABC transporter substrate-binding protein [Oryzicola mucosus]MBD0417164.1 ABC transporter substrate-binding protein [Oryzicola mucosus]